MLMILKIKYLIKAKTMMKVTVKWIKTRISNPRVILIKVVCKDSRDRSRLHPLQPVICKTVNLREVGTLQILIDIMEKI